jgi:hypothetical protein
MYSKGGRLYVSLGFSFSKFLRVLPIEATSFFLSRAHIRELSNNFPFTGIQTVVLLRTLQSHTRSQR